LGGREQVDQALPNLQNHIFGALAMISRLMLCLIIIINAGFNYPCFSQEGAIVNPSKLSFNLGFQYSIPFMDITLTRGTRKTVTHEVSPAIGLQTGMKYQFRTNKYLLIAVEYNSYNYKSTETFFNEIAYSSSDNLTSINIHAGLGWLFPVKENNKLFIQTSLVYLIHNNELKNFYSERVLPADLETIDITTIDWDVFNMPGIALGVGYKTKISKKLGIEFYDSVLFSIIEADIVDSPTSNDFDQEPNMSRAYWVNNLGVSFGYNF